MKLIIAEKPSVAADLARALPGKFVQKEGFYEGEEYLISWAVGHLLELAEPEDYDPSLKRWSLESLPILPDRFQRKPRSGQTKQLNLLKRLARRKDVTGLVNACDAAREGELIFREIQEYVGADKPVERLWLQSMTPESIREAFAQMESAERFEGLGAAAFSRSEADWLIGMNATRGITRRLKGRKERGVWSAGRVQTPTLALLVHRELKVLAHVPVPFWRVPGRFEANGHEYEAQFRRPSGKDREKIWEEAQARRVVEECQGKETEVSEKVTESVRRAPPLHNLTSLQKEANSRYGLSARRTLAAAQRLYEQYKLITYPRTDSNALPEDYQDHVHTVVAQLASYAPRGGAVEAARDPLSRGFFAEPERGEAIAQAALLLAETGLRNQKRNFDDSRVGDHFAIIPTENLPDGPLGGDDARVYELILRRFLAAFLEPSRWQKVVRRTQVRAPEAWELAPEGWYLFHTESNRLVEPGWQLVDRRPPASELLGDLGVAPGETARGRVLEVQAEEDATRPPARYTEAGLLKAMETASDLDLDLHEEIGDEEVLSALKEKGLGTPATRADIIEGLIAKGYAIRTGKTLRPTAKGIILIDFLERIHADHLARAEMTAEMEAHLYQVERGERDRGSYLREVRQTVEDLVEKLKTFEYEDLYKDDPPVGVDPKSGRPVIETLRGYSPAMKDGEERSWTIWKEYRGRYLNRPVVEKLLKEGDTGPLEGFVNQRGQPYAGRLRLDPEDMTVEFEPVRDYRGADEEGSAEPELVSHPVDSSPFVKCPVCKEGDIVETPTHFTCNRPDPKGREGRMGCGCQIPRTVCKRTLTREEVRSFFDPEADPAATDWIEDFISRRGRPFTARLVRNAKGRHSFEFKPRERRPRKKAAKKKTVKKKAARKKATKKKAAKKTASTKKKAGGSEPAAVPAGGGD